MRHATQMGGTHLNLMGNQDGDMGQSSEMGIRPGIGGKSSGGDWVTHFIHRPGTRKMVERKAIFGNDSNV